MRILITVLILVVMGQSYFLYQVYGPGGELDIKEELRQIKIANPEELNENQLEKLIMSECSLVPHTLDGTSLQPAFKHGSSHVFYEGEPCPIKQMIKRNSVVLLETGASLVPIAKFVKAMPGDKLAFDRRPGRVNVLTVNGEDVTNSKGQLYATPRDRQLLLQRYIEQYKGVVPINAYLLLGDNVRGSLDSTRLGLVHVNDIVGVMRDNLYEGKESLAVVPKTPAGAPRPAYTGPVTTDAPEAPGIPDEIVDKMLPKVPPQAAPVEQPVAEGIPRSATISIGVGAEADVAEEAVQQAIKEAQEAAEAAEQAEEEADVIELDMEVVVEEESAAEEEPVVTDPPVESE